MIAEKIRAADTMLQMPINYASANGLPPPPLES